MKYSYHFLSLLLFSTGGISAQQLITGHPDQLFSFGLNPNPTTYRRLTPWLNKSST